MAANQKAPRELFCSRIALKEVPNNTLGPAKTMTPIWAVLAKPLSALGKRSWQIFARMPDTVKPVAIEKTTTYKSRSIVSPRAAPFTVLQASCLGFLGSARIKCAMTGQFPLPDNHGGVRQRRHG